ncbi:MAG: nucleoside diphosphate kinase regulator [Pedobacter sp.]|nr:nucleoside diphosphate kinase regulator [Pedobacter sp.]
MNMSAPAITLSTLDVQRLERLLETPELAGLPMAEPLQAEIARARLCQPEKMPADVVTMNSVVHCRDEASGQEHHFTLVYPREADAASGKVSVLAPVGAALLGLRVGQNIRWQSQGSTLQLQLLAISYQPERAGDYHR